MKTLTPVPLTQENFAPFGDVIETGNAPLSINYGNTALHHDLANINVGNKGGHPLVSIFRTNPVPMPIKIEIMERHPLSSQAFVPLSDNPYLIVVAPKGDFYEKQIKAFMANSNQGVNYHAGTWHHYSLALGEVSDFLVIDRGGDGGNCDEVCLVEPFTITTL